MADQTVKVAVVGVLGTVAVAIFGATQEPWWWCKLIGCSAQAEMLATGDNHSPPASSDGKWRRATASSPRVEVYVRQRPSPDAAVIGNLTPKDVVHVANLHDGWWQAQLRDGKMGYVDAEFVKVID